MTLYRVKGKLSDWVSIRLKYGRNEPYLFIKILTGSINCRAELMTVILTESEYRYLKSEIDAYGMSTKREVNR